MSKSKRELEIENEILKKTGFGSNFSKVVIELIRYGALIAGFHYIDSMIQHLAGQVTTATIDIPFMNGVLGAIVGGGGMVYGHKQNKLRKNTVERLQNRIKELENRIDNRRSSSGLTNRGDTHPEDI